MSEFSKTKNCAVWFDLPVRDLDRAAAFYRPVLATEVSIESFGDIRFGVFAHDEGNGGCLVVQPDAITGTGGVLLYLNVDGRIEEAVAAVRAHGGQVVEDVHTIGPHGLRAIASNLGSSKPRNVSRRSTENGSVHRRC